jgi:hypothetical protein
MGRYRFPAFSTASRPRYVVLWDLHWHVLDCQRLDQGRSASADVESATQSLNPFR